MTLQKAKEDRKHEQQSEEQRKLVEILIYTDGLTVAGLLEGWPKWWSLQALGRFFHEVIPKCLAFRRSDS